MARSKDLEDNIRESYALIRKFQTLLREVENPRREASFRREIARQQGLIEGYRREYLGLRSPGDVPEDVREILGISAQPETPRGGIFLSYRREDSAGHAGRLYDRIAERFPGRPLFFDVEALEPGHDWVDALERALERCALLVAVIGPRWLTVTDRQGNPRLSQGDDTLRREIATALKRALPVLPLLVGGARMPGVRELAPDLQPLARRHALEIRDDAFAEGVERALDAVERLLPPGR